MRLHNVDDTIARLRIDLLRLLFDDRCFGLQLFDAGDERLVDVLDGTVQALDERCGRVDGGVDGRFGGAQCPAEDGVVAWRVVWEMCNDKNG